MLEQLIQIIHEEFPETAESRIDADSIIEEVISYTSLNIAILLTSIELEFDVLLKPADLRKCNTFSDLIFLIESNKG